MLVLSLDQLPPEILLALFCYLDVLDILRMRRVSRYLNKVSHRKDVWIEAYRKADFVRPPGPFLSQSAHDLESALVPSFRVDRYLQRGVGTAQSEKPTPKPRKIRYTGGVLHLDLVLGRFLVVAFSDEVRCYDLNLDASFDTNSGASIIYRSTGGFLKFFRCVSAVDVEGRPFACAVLTEVVQAGKQTQFSIYSLNVAEPSEVTLDLLHQFQYNAFDAAFVDLGPRIIVAQGRVGPAPSNDCVVALDVHARTQFLLPSFTGAASGADRTSEWTPNNTFASISTSTHLLLARSFDTRAAGPVTVFQAYTLPLPNTHVRSTALSHSHRGIIPGIVSSIVLLHDAIRDPSTHAILITIRMHIFDPSRFGGIFVEYGTLCLGTSHHDAIGTITFRQLLASFSPRSQIPFLHPSFNGTGRAFYAHVSGSYGVLAVLEYDVHSDGCSDDTPRAKVMEYRSVLRFPDPRLLLDYDPYSGRICLESLVEKDRAVEILDLLDLA